MTPMALITNLVEDGGTYSRHLMEGGTHLIFFQIVARHDHF